MLTFLFLGLTLRPTIMLDFEAFEVVTSSKPGAFPSALRNKRDDVQSDIKDAAAALVRDNRAQEEWSEKGRSGNEGTKSMD